MTHKISGWNWARIVGLIITFFIILDNLYWIALGIYIVANEPTNMEPILFASLHIGVLVALYYAIYLFFDSEDNWWFYGTNWIDIVVLWIVFFFLSFMDLFIMLAEIYDSAFLHNPNKNLLISLGAIQFAFTIVAWVYTIVIGILIFLYHGAYRRVLFVHPSGATQVVHTPVGMGGPMVQHVGAPAYSNGAPAQASMGYASTAPQMSGSQTVTRRQYSMSRPHPGSSSGSTYKPYVVTQNGWS